MTDIQSNYYNEYITTCMNKFKLNYNNLYKKKIYNVIEFNENKINEVVGINKNNIDKVIEFNKNKIDELIEFKFEDNIYIKINLLENDEYKYKLMNKNKIKYNYAGTLLFNTSLDKILLVRGSHAGKWGPPKGESNSGEYILNTALRETHEETGLVLNSDDAIKNDNGKPLYLFISDIAFYIFIIDESNEISPMDTNEICQYKWFNLSELKYQNKDESYYELYNSPLRQLNKLKSKYNLEKIIKIIKDKMQLNN